MEISALNQRRGGVEGMIFPRARDSYYLYITQMLYICDMCRCRGGVDLGKNGVDFLLWCRFSVSFFAVRYQV